MRRANAIRAVRALKRFSVFRSSRRVACYWGTKQEFPTDLVIKAIRQSGKELYLPVITDLRAGEMVFQRHSFAERLQVNAFGILQPEYQPSRVIPAKRLDLIIAPLLAFDAQGNRAGMGGGFYDRIMSFRHYGWQRPRPFYLGLAYERQRAGWLSKQHWDVPLDAVLTELGVQRFR